ncbi:MAG: NAD-dependent epimerase/dehydratase family protein [Candidatus Eisenbacteria bacterium]|nr:NAD-dependent epimerase/dehydratase family protein [Candidatus Eisenbacteria bacterium]
MRILVIGGTRFIGPQTAQRLVAEGHEAAVFHRGETEGALPEEVHHIHCPGARLGDRSHFAAYRSELRDWKPDVVLDMVCLTAKDAQILLDTFRGRAWRAVVISSQDVYRAYGRLIGTEPGPPDSLPLDEDAPLREKHFPYRGEKPRDAGDPRAWMDDYDKILVERAVMEESGLAGTILRLPMVYGPYDYQHRLFPHLKPMQDGRAALLLQADYAGWRWTRAYVENVAAAVALAVTDERAAGRIYNVGAARSLTMIEWVRAIGRAAGWEGRIVTLPADEIPEHLRETMDLRQELVTDSGRIRRELGYAEPVPFEEGLRRTVAWEAENPPESFDPAQFDYAAEDEALSRTGWNGWAGS